MCRILYLFVFYKHMCSFALFTPTAIHTTCSSASILIQPINTISTSYISLYSLRSIEHTLLSTNIAMPVSKHSPFIIIS
ncbi:hypothetical protein BDF22DRAFT_40178 [Syncephalis plumigaleata]|nr:hypothetical protein BDF22DRAFT_40178 [Syncephalis plumigaleata]